MPMEGQWNRARTPLNKRDRSVLIGVVALVAVAATMFGFAFAGGSGSPSKASCVNVDVPSTMGGARLHECGAAARTFCAEQRGAVSTIAAACRRQGFATDVSG
jgi:hypothetical protein